MASRNWNFSLGLWDAIFNDILYAADLQTLADTFLSDETEGDVHMRFGFT